MLFLVQINRFQFKMLRSTAINNHLHRLSDTYHNISIQIEQSALKFDAQIIGLSINHIIVHITDTLLEPLEKIEVFVPKHIRMVYNMNAEELDGFGMWRKCTL